MATADDVDRASMALELRQLGEQAADHIRRVLPLALAARNLQFWRWPESQGQGAALYFVIDQPAHLEGSLLLNVGETGQADRRWKSMAPARAHRKPCFVRPNAAVCAFTIEPRRFR